MKFTTTAAALTALITTAIAAKDERTFAVLRFTNKQLTKGRMDPIVSPNEVSNHVHNVMGGSAFGKGSTGEELMKSNCSNAMVKGDNSNYWYPALYFHDPKTGEFEDVEVFYTNAYYFFEPTNDDIKAFPVGMSMVSGDAMTRVAPKGGSTTNLDPSQGPVQPIKWTCPRSDSSYNPPSWPADSDGSEAGMGDPVNKGEGVGFPDVDCDGYASPLRADIHFPSCYNPDAGLTNFKENMAWPEDNDGKQDCPEGYIHVPHLFIEVYWNTPLFADRWEQNTGVQPFVLANGDVTGYSSHADFMAGWDEDLLQHIIDTCDAGTGGMDTCPGLTYGLNEGDCTIESAVDEQVDGTMSSLPGSITLQGWSYGTSDSGSDGGSGGDSTTTPAGAATTTKPAATSTKASEQDSTTDIPAPTSYDSSEETSEPSLPDKTTDTSDVAVSPAAPTTEASADAEETTKPAAPATTKAPATVPDTPAEPSTTVSECKPKVKTVYETVTVTAGGPESTQSTSNSTNTVGGYTYAGCFKDASDRVLSGAVRPDLGDVTNKNCVAHCKEAGFALAGTEYGGQCYCGNELVGSKEMDDSACDTKCEGDASDTCGGSWALSVYSASGEASMKGAKLRRHAHDHMLRHRSLRH